MQELNETAHKILDFAEYFTQTKGFNAFSYKDLQHEVGVKTSTIHYYFPTKQDLAIMMTERFVANFRGHLETIAQKSTGGAQRLEGLGQLFGDVVKTGRFCMCGMLASDMDALPEAVIDQLIKFFKLTENWVAVAIELGKEQGSIKSSVNTINAAAHFVATIEGGMLIARVQKHPEYLAQVVTEAINQMRP